MIKDCKGVDFEEGCCNWFWHQVRELEIHVNSVAVDDVVSCNETICEMDVFSLTDFVNCIVVWSHIEFFCRRSWEDRNVVSFLLEQFDGFMEEPWDVSFWARVMRGFDLMFEIICAEMYQNLSVFVTFAFFGVNKAPKNVSKNIQRRQDPFDPRSRLTKFQAVLC